MVYNMYSLLVGRDVDKLFMKPTKKNPKQLRAIQKKILEIRRSPVGYKYLRPPLHGFNRVHIDKHFVLIFKISHKEKVVKIYHFSYHDEVYKWSPR